MTKQDSLNTRVQMLAMSFKNNTEQETKGLLNSWGLLDLFTMRGLNELSMIFTGDNEKLEYQNSVILDVINERANAIADELIEIVKELREDKNPKENAQRIMAIKKQFPSDQWDELINQVKELKSFFKKEWPSIRKKNLGK